jgi:hypothetical protein
MMTKNLTIKILFTKNTVSSDEVADTLVKISRYVREGYIEGHPLTTPGEMPGVEWWGVGR